MWRSSPPFLYAPSPFVATASAVGAVAMAVLALSELRGDNLAYSKFSRGGGQGKQRRSVAAGALLPSRAAMLLIYAPALVAALASFAVPGAVDGARAHLLGAALAVHFLKRVLEPYPQPSRPRQQEMWPSPPFLYTASPSVAMASAAAAVVVAVLALSEFRGYNLAYSKFSRGGQGKQQRGVLLLLPSRGGMLIGYAPALVAALASFAAPGVMDGARSQLLSAAIAVHFLKRVLEVLFIHRYSGSMPLATALLMVAYYLSIAVGMIYVQYITRVFPEPAVDLLYSGVLVFAVGVTGNFYHHWLLSRLRVRTDGGGDHKEYKIPTGGLFGLITCPHYLFEIVAFFGFAMISQTLYALTVALGTAAYLAGRSCATRKWYASKFEDFPARINALVPYIW